MNPDLQSVGLVLFSYGFLARNQHFLQARLADSAPGIVGFAQKTRYPPNFFSHDIPIALDAQDTKLGSRGNYRKVIWMCGTGGI